MLSITILSYFCGLWGTVYLVDAGLRSHPATRQWYSELTAQLGLSLHPLHLRFFTQRLNRIFYRICQLECIPWEAWFTIGAVFSALLMLFSVCLLSLLVYNTVMKKPIENQIITPVMPGVNLPLSHLGFYMATLLICGLLHEAGHALAALRERVRLNGFGLFLFGVYPGAFVDLNSADLQVLPPVCQLRIYCAGVWHNAVIAVLGLVVYYALPWLLSPGYALGTGVGVTYLQQDSVVTGSRGLSIGDAITRVNSCPVSNQSDWYRCLYEAQHFPSGYCVSSSYIKSVDAGSQFLSGRRSLSAVAMPPTQGNNAVETLSAADLTGSQSNGDCCSHQSASTHLCFTYLAQAKYGRKSRRYACLPARAVTERASCKLSSDCASGGLLAIPINGSNISAGHGSVPRNMVCVIPSPPDNTTRLVRLVHNRQKSPAILFLGPMDDLLNSVGVSDYVPRVASFLSPRLPMVISLICMYLSSLSGALVILNVVPCYALDGQWILQALLNYILPHRITGRRFRNGLYTVILTAGTGLLFTNVALALWYLFLEVNSASEHHVAILPHTDSVNNVAAAVGQ